ncbi:aminopeptidase N [Corynebacterium kozikiae]|uniref:aminopeptidase N n=1 Tax=Corynebacterium kozikiae TaxID=2968469 RepID=UPI00211C0485|nr:aminopeptidase N [Corynebacterium sp. 76QC2CO]MCQ9343241.1 aminopeptidase N [Corynebacterium sp. 76QC2CO]
MSSINLTQLEAEARASLLKVHHYAIELDLTRGETEFGSTTTITFEGLGQGETFIDLRAHSISVATLDGVPLELGQAAELEKSGIPLTITEGHHELRIEALCSYSRTGQGLHRFVDPADGEVYLYSQFETADAKRVFACFDQPDLKATYSFAITAPQQWKVITNATMEVTETTGADGKPASLHTGAVDTPLSTYLVAFCAGNYFEVTDTYRGSLTHHAETPADQPHEVEIPMAIYCRQSLAKHLDADTLFTQTKQGFDFYHANFGYAYPFGKYDQLFVPEFNMGAMENAGAVTFRDEYVFSSKVTRYRYERRCDTILHEMAHMWFGDLVTMQWWGDLWLNESFATWAAAISQAEATEFDTAWVTFASVEKSWAYQQDQLPSTHPITADATDIETVEQNFDGITYAKGASVLKQLQAYVGREAFFAGVRKHFATHAFGNATFDDLLAALAEASGRDLSGWAQQWLKTTGVNTLATKVEKDGRRITRLAIEQRGAQPGAGELRDHRVAVGLYSLAPDGVVRRTNRVELDVTGALTEIPEFAGQEADLILINDEDLTYALLELDPASLEFALANIDRIEDPMARSLCWSAAWEMTRAGTMRARDFIALAARGAKHETEIAVLERVLLQATSANARFVDPSWEGHNVALADLLLAGAKETTGDIQLAFVQALSRTPLAESPEALELFAQIAAGESPLPGLEVDEDLRWAALTARIAAGKQEDAKERIDALSAEYRTAASELAALRAQAALPTQDTKDSVFAEITALDNTLSNLQLRHKLEGLRAPGAGPLLQAHNSAAFELALPLWENLSSEVALVTLGGIYPSWDISQEGVQRAAAFLEQDNLPGGLRRVILEGKAEQERALRNRAFDRS